MQNMPALLQAVSMYAHFFLACADNNPICLAENILKVHYFQLFPSIKANVLGKESSVNREKIDALGMFCL